jgi:hypothetical protein
VEQEEAREAEVGDHAQLLLEPRERLLAQRAPGVALVEPGAAELGELAVGARVLRPRVAVGEPAAEVEPQALGEPLGLEHRVGVVAEALGHRVGGREDMGRVAAPRGLGLVERPPQPNGDERVLERHARALVRVDVAGRHARHAEPLGELRQEAVAAAVAACERALELDAQAVAPERGEQAAAERCGAGVVAALDARGERARARAARQADEAGGVALDLGERDARREQPVAGLPALPRARALVRAGEDAAEVAPAALVLAEQRHVRAVVERDLRPGDRAHAEGGRLVRQLHRAVDGVVVGQRERLVALLGGHGGELARHRGAVEERVGRVRVELDVGHEHMFAYGAD